MVNYSDNHIENETIMVMLIMMSLIKIMLMTVK